jgi:hypothetical protein
MGILVIFLVVSVAFSQETIADSLYTADYDAYEDDVYEAAAKEAVEDVVKKERSSGISLGWRGWTRIAAFVGTAAFGGLAIASHIDVNKKIKDLNALTMKELQNNGPLLDSDWYKKSWNSKYNEIRDKETARNIYSGFAGGLALAGIVTFFF